MGAVAPGLGPVPGTQGEPGQAAEEAKLPVRPS
jgi:hypothetical protein